MCLVGACFVAALVLFCFVFLLLLNLLCKHTWNHGVKQIRLRLLELNILLKVFLVESSLGMFCCRLGALLISHSIVFYSSTPVKHTWNHGIKQIGSRLLELNILLKVFLVESSLGMFCCRLGALLIFHSILCFISTPAECIMQTSV